MSFKIGSLFDGSGGFPLAASMCRRHRGMGI